MFRVIRCIHNQREYGTHKSSPQESRQICQVSNEKNVTEGGEEGAVHDSTLPYSGLSGRSESLGYGVYLWP